MHIKHLKYLGTLPDSETGEPTQVGVDKRTGLLVAIMVVDIETQDTVDDMDHG